MVGIAALARLPKIAKGIASLPKLSKPTRKSIGELTAINQGSPAFRNRVGFVENYLKNNKIKTLDDLNLLFDNLRNTKVNKMLDPNLTVEGVGQGKFPPYEGQMKDMGTNLKNVIRWSNMPDKAKTAYTNKISKILRQKKRDVSHAGRTELDYKNFENNLSNIKSIMEKDKTKSFVDAFKEAVSEVKSTRSGFRRFTWDYWTQDRLFEGKLTSGRLQKENPDLYNFFKDIIKVPKVKPRGSLAKEYGKTPYDYIKTFTQRDNPEMYNIFFTKNKNGKIVQKPALQKIFGEKFLRQMHLMGENLGTTTVANLKDLVSKYEMIPKKFVEQVRRPQFIGTPKMNSEHLLIEMGRTKGEKGLIDLLVDKFDVMGYNWTKNKKGPGGTWNPISTKEKLSKSDIEKIKEINVQIKAKEKALRDLGLESVFYDPSKKNLVYFGGEFIKDVKTGTERFVSPLDPNLMQLRKEYLTGNRKEGGLINSDLTDTIPPTGGPMSEGIPLLDPQESIDKANRQRFAAGGAASAFTNLFSKLSKVPRAVGRFGDIKKPTLAKPKLAGEIALSQAPEDKPAMFLSTVNAIEETPDAAKMNAQQWLGTIKNKKGVSEVELDEFGLEPLLNNIAKNNPKRIITKPELVEMYGREMPKIDMSLSLAEPVSRGAKDLASMLLNVRKSKQGVVPKHLEGVNIMSDDARLIGALHQSPQDRVGFVIRNNLVDIMKNTNVDGDNLIRGERGYHSLGWDIDTGSKFAPMWKQAFPKMYDKVNDIVKEGHKDVLATLVPAEDVTRLSQAKNISQEEAFEQLYQALNIFDRRVINRDVPIPFYTKKLLYRMGDMAEGRGFTYRSIGRPGHEGVNQDLPGRAGYGELKFYFNFDEGATRSKELKYQDGHFGDDRFVFDEKDLKYVGSPRLPESNAPFGWARFSERIDESGRKILLIEETQSDLHQSIMKGNFKYADRLDKSGVLMEMGDLSKQLSVKIDTLASTRLRKDNILALPRAERELPANKAELKNAEDAIKKLIKDKKDLEKKIEAAEAATGRSGSVYPEAPFKKSENYAKMFIQGVLKMAHDKGYDGVAVSTGRMKKHYGSIPKGGDKFYDEIAVKAMKKISKKSGFRFSDTTLTDGEGYTWERIPIIELKDKVTGEPIPGTSVLSAYKKGGIVNQNMVRGYNGY